jgi:hypothetical protein
VTGKVRRASGLTLIAVAITFFGAPLSAQIGEEHAAAAKRRNDCRLAGQVYHIGAASLEGGMGECAHRSLP